MRSFLMDGEFFVGASLATVLTKLALRFIELNQDAKKKNVRWKFWNLLVISVKKLQNFC